MDPPPHYASTYGALHFSNFSVKRAEIPDVKLSQETVNNATILIDEKWPEYIFENELNAKEKWENYQVSILICVFIYIIFFLLYIILMFHLIDLK